MNREEIMADIRSLANSQGFYSRLYRNLMAAKENDPESYEDFMCELEEQNFKDSVDLVLYLET